VNRQGLVLGTPAASVILGYVCAPAAGGLAGLLLPLLTLERPMRDEPAGLTFGFTWMC